MRQRFDGYIYWGRPRIPPLPQNIVMEDRVTGTQYFLTHTGSLGSLVFEVSTTIPTKPDTLFYGPHDGPYLPGNVRLFVQNGALDGEPVVLPDLPVSNHRVLTRRANERFGLEVTLPDSWEQGDPFTYTEVEFRNA
jgi:hypothetical protein